MTDFAVPEVAVNPDESKFANEWATHYGIIVGGMKVNYWNRIGEDSIGHHLLERRTFKTFTRLAVGRRNEFDGALDMPETVVTEDWHKNAARVVQKSPKACARDFLSTFKPMGGCVPEVLTGHPDPQALCEEVWPAEVRLTAPLHQQIAYFENFQTNSEAAGSLAASLLEALYVCRDWILEYIRTLKNEMDSEKGLRVLNENLKELFYEVGEPLPEERTALIAQRMGKEIVEAGQGGKKDEALINALNRIAAGQEQLLTRVSQLEASSEQQAQTEENAPEKEASTAQTSNTSTRRTYFKTAVK